AAEMEASKAELEPSEAAAEAPVDEATAEVPAVETTAEAPVDEATTAETQGAEGKEPAATPKEEPDKEAESLADTD
ncbi:MAG: hypothetical protein V3T68_04490, partial [Dehalococcoidales bacterium]